MTAMDKIIAMLKRTELWEFTICTAVHKSGFILWIDTEDSCRPDRNKSKWWFDIDAKDRKKLFQAVRECQEQKFIKEVDYQC